MQARLMFLPTRLSLVVVARGEREGMGPRGNREALEGPAEGGKIAAARAALVEMALMAGLEAPRVAVVAGPARA